MSFSWDSADREVLDTVDAIVRAAVVYGYLSGFAGAAATAGQDGPGFSPPSRIATDESLAGLSREAAEEFLIKVRVEQIISP